MTLSKKVKSFKYLGEPLSQSKIKQSIRAMEKLITIYQGNDTSEYCLLCTIGYTCLLCPWQVLTKGNDCNPCENTINQGNAPQRIRQLRHWIKAYQDNLK